MDNIGHFGGASFAIAVRTRVNPSRILRLGHAYQPQVAKEADVRLMLTCIWRENVYLVRSTSSIICYVVEQSLVVWLFAALQNVMLCPEDLVLQSARFS